jgi:hypothetical protein
MSSGCWKWLPLPDSRAIVERCHREFKKNLLCFLGNHLKLVMHVQIILEMIGCCLNLLENFLYAHQATDWFIQETRKSPRPSLSSFTFFHQGLSCVSLQETLIVAIVFWQSQSYISFWSLTLLALILRIQQTYLPVIRWNFPLGNMKSEVWFYLTRAESQAAMMVCVPQGLT